jgi:hypothetical protein
VNGKMHEFLITPWSGALDRLPHDSANSVVLETSWPSSQVWKTCYPNATTTMRLVLRPGEYVVFSNQLSHDYRSGMAP